jgi:Protein of unknown function (DUF3551)
MRLALTGLIVLAATLAADMQSGSTQESFYNQRFCTRGGRPTGGAGADCAFNTWQQCIEAARGLGRYCAENPNWHGPRAQPTTQGRSPRNR